MYLLGALFWLVMSGLIAWNVAHMLTRLVRWKGGVLINSGLTVLLWPVAFMAPLADEIVGKHQFDRLCEEAKEVRIYGVVPVGEELYTNDGKWRGFDTGDDPFRLEEIKRLHLRWDVETRPTELHMAIPIHRYERRMFAVETGRMLAEWREYGTPGGWFSRQFQTPLLVRLQCTPKLVQESQIEQRILPFKFREGAMMTDIHSGRIYGVRHD